MFRRITIVRIRRPGTPDVNEKLQTIGESLGLFSPRDKDKSCFRIFITLLHALKRGEPLASDEIAYRTGLTRGTVIHHVNKLIASGIVEHERGGYLLTFESLEALIDRVENNVKDTLESLRNTAQETDERLGL